MKSAEFFDLQSFQVALYSSKGSKGKERKNEDSCGFISPTNSQVALVVSDGMGGHKMGDRASNIVVNTILGRNTGRRRPFKSAQMIEKMERAHQKISDLKVNAGATAVVAVIQSDGLWFYSVGDSLGVLFSPRGDVIYKTFEHSVTGFAQESGLLEEKEAQIHDQSNIILNSLGFHDSRMESSFKLQLSVEDTVFLCTDGLTELLTLGEIYGFYASKSVEEGTAELVRKCRALREEKSDFDDLTFVVCRKK